MVTSVRAYIRLGLPRGSCMQVAVAQAACDISRSLTKPQASQHKKHQQRNVHTLVLAAGDEILSVSLDIRREPAASAFPASLSKTVALAADAFSISYVGLQVFEASTS